MRKHKIAIITPEKDPYSTTFISAHMELLQGEKVHLFGKFFPSEGGNVNFRVRQNRVLRSLLHRLKLHHVYHKWVNEKQLGKFLAEKDVDLVLAEFGPVGAEVVEVCKRYKIPLITHFHGFDAHAYKVVERYQEKYIVMFQYASTVIAVSKFMEKALLDLGCPASKLLLNPYGPRDEFFELNPSFDNQNFLAVGRFVDKKAPHTTIKAFAELVKIYPKAVLQMVGDGPLLDSSKQLVKSLGISGNIEFCGALDHDEVKALFNTSICFVQHSVVAPNGDSEGTPVAILEAGAAGLPVVATRHAGITDVVLEGETGLLVDEKDEVAFASKLIEIATDIESAKLMGKKARERMLKNYKMEIHLDRLQHVIDEAAQKEVH